MKTNDESQHRKDVVLRLGFDNFKPCKLTEVSSIASLAALTVIISFFLWLLIGNLSKNNI
jgi:hypothetical protein